MNDPARTPAAGPLQAGVDYLTRLVELQPVFTVALASLFYCVITCYRAHRRLFWFDEIFTFYISRLPNIASIWEACTHGADLNPPLLYLITRWSQDLFGANELGTRMPQIAGFLVFCLCLYRFVSVRSTAVGGLIAMLFPLTTGAYWYAYDARSHGLVLGFFGLALLSWQAAATRAPRKWGPVVGLAASLTGAALCHCFAFLLFIPFGVGELARTKLRRHFDSAVWCALALPAIVSVATVLPLLRGAHDAVNSRDLEVQPFRLFENWNLAVQPALLLAIALLFALRMVRPRAAGPVASSPDAKTPGRTFEPHEIAFLAATLCTPIFAFLAALLAHAPFWGRYSLIIVAAVGSLIAAASARSKTTAALVLTLTALSILGGFDRFYALSFDTEPATDLKVGTLSPEESFGFSLIASAAPGSEPVVVLDDLEFGPLFHYSPLLLQPRLVFLVPERNGEGYSHLQKYTGAPGNVLGWNEFMAAHRTFYVYTKRNMSSSEADVLPRLASGSQIALQACNPDRCLFHVQLSSPR